MRSHRIVVMILAFMLAGAFSHAQGEGEPPAAGPDAAAPEGGEVATKPKPKPKPRPAKKKGKKRPAADKYKDSKYRAIMPKEPSTYRFGPDRNAVNPGTKKKRKKAGKEEPREEEEKTGLEPEGGAAPGGEGAGEGSSEPKPRPKLKKSPGLDGGGDQSPGSSGGE